MGAPDNETIIIGKIIADINEYGEYEESSLSDLNYDRILEIAEKIGLNKDDIKLISSTRMS